MKAPSNSISLRSGTLTDQALRRVAWFNEVARKGGRFVLETDGKEVVFKALGVRGKMKARP